MGISGVFMLLKGISSISGGALRDAAAAGHRQLRVHECAAHGTAAVAVQRAGRLLQRRVCTC